MPDRLNLPDRLTSLIASYDVPGAAASVLVDGRIIDAAAGVINLRTGVETRPNSPFMIQSITKVWTATLVMQLVDEGLVELDQPLRRYLPTFRTADAAASARITVRHLLTHSGGFDGDIWADTTAGDDALQRLVEDHVSVAPQHVQPGRLYSYCSAGMAVLGRLVEVLRQLPYAASLHRHLTDPLSISEVAANANEALRFRTAIGHVSPRPGAPQQPVKTWAVMPPSNPAAGNQLAMPASGLIAFAQLHLNDGVTADGTRLLSAESARAMRTPQLDHPAALAAPVRQGLGWMLPAPGVVSHSGGTIGSDAMLRLVPERGVAIALLANGGDATGLIHDLYDELLAELACIAPAVLPPVPDPAPVAGAERYTGRYELPNGVCTVEADERGRLWLTGSGRNQATTMAEAAGVRFDPSRVELRRAHDDVFVRVDDAGNAAGAVEFMDIGAVRCLHTGQAMPRVS